MSFEAKSSRVGLASLVAVGMVLSLTWVTSASAAPYSLTGNTRSQIGNGLPLPITFALPPQGKVPLDTPVNQTAGPDPKNLTLPGTVTNPGATFGPLTTTIPLFNSNSNVFQLRTSLIVKAAPGPRVLQAGGGGVPARTSFLWCPGMPLPNATYNPNCTNPSATGLGIIVKGSIRYQKTVAQFGGANAGRIGGGTKGGASIALRVGSLGAPCTWSPGAPAGCLAGFSQITPAATAAFGQALGGNANTYGAPQITVWPVRVSAAGFVQSVFGTGPIATAPGNGPVQSFGGPWTTGKVTVKAPAAGETFYLQGNDGRVNGLGSLSLVSGGVAYRAISKVQANRGWATYQLSPFVPAISNTGLVLLALIFATVTVRMIWRARAPAR